jgi:voltage-gated potassium channel Kch
MKQPNTLVIWSKAWLTVVLAILPIVAVVVGPLAFAIGGSICATVAIVMSFSLTFHAYIESGWPSGVVSGIVSGLATALAYPFISHVGSGDYQPYFFSLLISCGLFAMLTGLLAPARALRPTFTEVCRLLLIFIALGFPVGYFLLKATLAVSLLLGPAYSVVYFLGLYVGKCIKPIPARILDIWPYLKAMAAPLSGFSFVYFSIATVFATYFWALYSADSASFTVPSLSTPSFFDFFYFSFVTIATVGYGDIVPLSPLARGLVVAEVVLGVGWITVGFAAVLAFLQKRFHQISRSE